MKNPIVYITSILFPFLSFSQWTSIIPYSQNVMIYSPISGEAITLGKNSDTVWFSDWKRDLKLFGMQNTSFTGKDFSEIDLIDSMKLEEAYNAACVGCPLKWPTTPQAAIELIEVNFLYRGYDNVFKLAATWPDDVKEYRIEATDATVKTITRNNQIIHTINPKGRTCEMKIIYKDVEGFEQSYGPWLYAVRALPMPFITNSNISKSSGGKINVALPESPIGGVSFKVLSLEYGENLKIIDSNIIPAETLKKIKVGKMMPLVVNAINLLTGEVVIINVALKVID